MRTLAALPVAVPLLAAGLLAATDSVARRWVSDALATLTALAVSVMCALLLAKSAHGPIVLWFGGWRPSHGVALGVSFSIDSLGAGMATLVAVLVTASLVFSWRYFDAIGSLFHALMLVFLAAMAGFSLTGDLFDMFVFFELMSVSAYALTAYRIEERGPIQGAINFAVVNSMGAFCILIGIALLYSRTGALNLAQLGQALATHRSDMLVVVALLLILAGLLVKGAVVPMHFWLADAHAVAPAPVCVLFSGAMVELALFGAARVFWTVFSGPLGPHLPALRGILLGLGVATALVGGTMCYVQRHLKRLLAFSTVSHVGVFVIGIALLSADGLAGSSVYVIAHGLTKGALFMCVGILVHRFASVDEVDLHGRGRARGLRITAAVFVLGSLVLASTPMLGTFFGKALIGSSAHRLGLEWVSVILALTSMLTGGAMLRVAGGVFLGWGPKQSVLPRRAEDREQEQASREEEPETGGPHERTPVVMVAPAAVLAVAGTAIGLVPGVVRGVQHAAAHFRDRAAYASTVLHGAHPRFADAPASHLSARDFVFAASGLTGALLLAGAPLFGRRLLGRLPHALRGGVEAAVAGLRALHSGDVGDYVTWLLVALGTIGGAFALTLR